MRKPNRRWLWLLIPLVGAGATLALPPIDEYAPLDRIGTRYDPVEEGRMAIPPDAPAEFRAELERMNRQQEEWMRKAQDQMGVARQRDWKVQAPEGEARQTLDRLFSARFGWQKNGGGTGSSSDGEHKSTSVTTSYVNDETGDQADVETTTQVAPVRGPASIRVTVSQSKASLQPWPRIKRWFRRAFAGR